MLDSMTITMFMLRVSWFLKICSCLCDTAEFMHFINLSWQRCRSGEKRC